MHSLISLMKYSLMTFNYCGYTTGFTLRPVRLPCLHSNSMTDVTKFAVINVCDYFNSLNLINPKGKIHLIAVSVIQMF